MASNVLGSARELQPGSESGVPSEGSAEPTDWRSAYSRLLWISDLAVLALVVFGTQIVWFGGGSAQVSIREDSRLSVFSYWLFSSLLFVAWMWSPSLIDSRSDRTMGTGSA